MTPRTLAELTDDELAARITDAREQWQRLVTSAAAASVTRAPQASLAARARVEAFTKETQPLFDEEQRRTAAKQIH